MEPLNERLAALIAEETASVEPPPGAKAKHWAAVAGAFGVAATAAGTASATTAGSAGVKSGLLLKVLGTVVVGGAVAGSAWSLSRPEPDVAPVAVADDAGAGADGERHRGPSAPAVRTPESSPQPEAESDPPQRADAEAVVAAERAVDAAEPAKANRRPPRAVTRRADPRPTPRDEVDKPAGLAEELALVESMRKAVATSDFRRALSLAARHRDEFPDGALRPDRMDLEASAHCGAGDVDRGRAVAARRTQRWPRSPTSERLRKACDLDEP